MTHELFVKAPEMLFHGSRQSFLEIKELSVFEVMNLEGEYRQIFGGNISLTDNINEAKKFARHNSKWENFYQIENDPTIFEYKVSQQKYFLDVSRVTDLVTLRDFIIPIISKIYQFILDTFNQEVIDSFEALIGILHDEVFSGIELNLMRLYSMSNMFNIQVFSSLNRAFCLEYDLIGITGIVPSTPDENNEFTDIRDFSVCNFHELTLMESFKI